MGTGRRKLSGVNGDSATRVTGAERAAGAACAATELVRIAVMTAMVSKSDTDTVKQRRRRVSRTLLSGSAQTEQYRLLLGNQYGNPYTPTSRGVSPVVVAETVVEPARVTWCDWIFSCRCERR